jgi:hypothetical protein
MIWVVQDTKDHLSSYCKKCHLSNQKENYDAKVIKRYHLKRVYKITLEDYNEDRNLLQQMIDYLSSFDSDLDISSLP